MKKLLLALLCLGLVGCATVRSDYGNLTSVIYPPKAEQEEVLLLTGTPQRPYKEIGIITVEARKMKTSLNDMNEEILKKAREAGADAVMNLQYSGGEKSEGMVGGEDVSFTTQKQAKGVAIVFTDKK